MASQTSQFSSSSCLCMPLAKFSHATVHAGNTAPIPWIHLASQNDLFILIDSTNVENLEGISETRWKFKVLQDPNFHEDIDLSLLATEARRAIETVQISSEPRRQPSVLVIVKQPCIAMRYPLEGNLVRRFQIRFQRTEDYYETLKILTRENVPITEAGALPSRLTTAPQDGYIASSSAFTVPARPSTSIQTCTLNPLYEANKNAPTNQPSLALRTSSSHPTLGTFMPHKIAAPGEFSASQPVQGLQSINSSNDLTLFQSAQAGSSTCNEHVASIPTFSHLPASSLSRFVPRPSTAPVIYAQSLNAGSTASGKASQQRGGPPTNETNRMAISDMDVTSESVYSTQRVDDEQTKKQPARKSNKKGEKRVAAKTRGSSVAKKPKGIAPQRNSGGQAMSHQDSISNIERLQPDEQATFDTQTLLHKVEQKLATQRTRSETRKAQDIVMTYEDTLAITNNTSIQQPHTGNTGETLANSGSAKPQATEALTEPTTQSKDRMDIQETNPTTSAVNQTTGLSHSQPQVTSLHLPSFPTTTTSTNPNIDTNSNPQRSLKSLLSDPHFSRPIPIPTAISSQPQTTSANPNTPSNPSDSHIDFNTLPESQRRIVLESWMVQTLQDESFVRLCKTLDGMWQKIFLYQ